MQKEGWKRIQLDLADHHALLLVEVLRDHDVAVVLEDEPNKISHYSHLDPKEQGRIFHIKETNLMKANEVIEMFYKDMFGDKE